MDKRNKVHGGSGRIDKRTFKSGGLGRTLTKEQLIIKLRKQREKYLVNKPAILLSIFSTFQSNNSVFIIISSIN